jgi:hypothetical protein
MLRTGSTVTLEAWDWKFKNNLDWNHAWGAAPANIIPRRLVGVEPLEPGCGRIRIQPRPGRLRWFHAKVPTIRGPVVVDFYRTQGRFVLELDLPGNLIAEVHPPLPDDGDGLLMCLDSRRSAAASRRGVLTLGSGRHRVHYGVPRQ